MSEPRRGGFTVQVDGRTVVVSTGTVTQTVNVCTPENIAGKYEARYRLQFVNAVKHESDLTARSSLDDLGEWLRQQNGADEGPTGTPPPPAAVVPADGSDPWVAEAVVEVDAAIDALVTGFVAEPYRHRVEHSLHTELVTALMRSDLLRETVAIGTTGHRTQLVHKEWPETAIRRDRGRTVERRGLFDVVVLAPKQLGVVADLDQFTSGRIAPPIVVELGLGYGLPHLRGDITKLENSGVPCGRIVHLSRLPSKDRDAVEAELSALATAPDAPVRGAYGYHDRAGRTAVKLLGDADFGVTT